ncbi:hypothetical protein T492DRAFT_522391 [Pavlovales sp. CCMP2436]|nr:hypothetical protein T492DRAFT_522391 [Pavlovales sp. CCMP2436]
MHLRMQFTLFVLAAAPRRQITGCKLGTRENEIFIGSPGFFLFFSEGKSEEPVVYSRNPGEPMKTAWPRPCAVADTPVSD